MASVNKPAVEQPLPAPSNARERILETAYNLFSRHGIRAIGVDTIIAHSNVAKMTLYRHFPSKEDLVLAFLERREELWTRGVVQRGVEARASAPADKLLAIFDVFDKWFQQKDFDGCSFINVLLEFSGDTESRIYAASVENLATIRAFVRELAAEAGIKDPDDFARQWHILMKGSIVAAGEGDLQAARRAKDVANMLLTRELPPAGKPAGNGRKQAPKGRPARKTPTSVAQSAGRNRRMTEKRAS
jgi:AcrR family transcriptional regulator